MTCSHTVVSLTFAVKTSSVSLHMKAVSLLWMADA